MPMNLEQIKTLTAEMTKAADILGLLSLEEFQAVVQRDNTLGPILDPTAWRDRNRLMEKLAEAAGHAIRLRDTIAEARSLGIQQMVREAERTS